MTRNSPHTDLAIEICEEITRNNSFCNGIECIRKTKGAIPSETVRITNEKGAEITGKPQGTYVTLNVGKLWMDDRERFKEKVYAFRDVLKKMLPHCENGRKSILVAGLGNRSITADAIGPMAVKHLIVTRHIKDQKPLIFEELGLFDTCALTPGVLGQTGIESADIIRSVAEKIRPGLLLVIDALASRDLGRLVSTIQLCDSGIRPGSGIGNSRPALDPNEMGIPILSIGVPTVVDAATLAADAMSAFSEKRGDAEQIRREWSKNGLNFFVTPKETDEIIQVMGSFIGYGINLALNTELSFEDMLSLIG